MKKFIKSTVGLCPTCYRHIPGEIYEQNNKVYLETECKLHGLNTSILENDAEFYHSIIYDKNYEWPANNVVHDVTDKCNLKCPNCYHLPDNKSLDRPEFEILDELRELDKSIPYEITLGGAEVTLRTNLVSLMKKSSEVCDNQPMKLLTNGVQFHKFDFVKELVESGVFGNVIVGLNHWQYQGKTVHKKQLQGLKNLRILHNKIPAISYTLDDYSVMEEVIVEGYEIFKRKEHKVLKIRPGADIGRTNTHEGITLSDTVKLVKHLCKKLGMEFKLTKGENKIYHHNALINEMPVMLESWPDVHRIEMTSCLSGGWANFIKGPVTNLYHQMVIRDGFVNKGLPQLDDVPYEFTRNGAHGKPKTNSEKINKKIPIVLN